MLPTRVTLFFLVFSSGIVAALQSQEPPPGDSRTAQPGHSVHADAFNEGPRQAAYLMQGMGNVHWEISTKNPMAQRFFDQGIVQLHGFWYFEAERSFRQAASFDPDCPILYWGMARANIENPFRSKGFIEQAMAKLEKANAKEKRLIEAWNKRVKDEKEDLAKSSDTRPKPASEKKSAVRAKKRNDEKEKKERQQRLKDYVRDIEEIAYDYPNDVEIKAMLVLQYWQNNGSGIDIQSHFAINALLTDIFHTNPRHPAHHFRIHLWDYKQEKLAVDAAAKCGPSAPGIAHMWHMPGHTYSRLHRYADAAWQQEASARVDHAQMMRDHLMPDQIHNYSHNNEWLIRDLMLVGRVREAVNLAKNMIELPRHPKFNVVDGRGSASLGRDRLLGVLTNYRLWPELIELANSTYLEGVDDVLRQDERKAWLAIAYANTNSPENCLALRGELESVASELRTQMVPEREALRLLADAEEKEDTKRPKPPQLLEPFEISDDLFGDEKDPSLPKTPGKEVDESESKDWSEGRKEKANALREKEHRVAKLKLWILAVDASLAAQQGRMLDAVTLSHQCRSVINALTRLEWYAQSGNASKALEKITKRNQDGPNEFLPLAIGVWIASQCEDNETVRAISKPWIEALSPIAASADTDLPELARLAPYIEKLGLTDRWKASADPASDVGDRPSLDSLGPFRWSPSMAPIWSAVSSEGEMRSTKHFSRRPVVLILYLGIGCVHCAEQLKEFSPLVAKFREAEMDVIGISTENLSQLQSGLRGYDGQMQIPLMANPELDIFKSFRCFDDFEGQPLHGTFLIDTRGRIRWQDIGHQPFMDPSFLLKEAKRLIQVE